MAANSYQNTFEDHTTESIQDTFHFDSNQFLIPDEGEGAPLDYEDLFSMLNQPAAQGSWGSSGIEHPIQSTGSEVVIASSSVPQAASSPPLQSQQQQQHKQQVQRSVFKSSRDITFKRSRDGGSGRSKQHQLKELEALAAKKNEDLERLMQENDELKFRSQILEKVVQMREYQLKVLRGPPQGRPQFWGVLSTAGTQHYDAAAAGAASADVGQEARCATAGMMWQCPNAAAAAPALCGNGIPPASMAIKMASCGCLLPCSEWSLSVEDRERFRSLGKAQLMEGWKHFLSEVSVPLLVFESNDEDERAAACIRELALEATHMFKHASLLAPDTVMVASQTHLETEVLASAEPSHWRNVVRALALTYDQVRELRAVFRLFSGIMAGILAERKTINERLADGSQSSAVDIGAAMEQLRVSAECEMLQVLQRSLRREKAAHLLLRGFLFGRTLSVLQFVRASVYSYPWMPDATAIVATVAETSDATEDM